jgi:hypothetical protein
MLVKMYIRRSRRILISFDRPLPPAPIPRQPVYQNTIAEGLKIQAFINSDPERITWAKTRKELNISESKLAHLLKIVNTLPTDFIEKMKGCDDPRKLKIFNGRKLLNISRLKTEKERCTRLRLLMRNYKLLPRAPVIPLPSINPDRQPIAIIAK